MSDDPILAALIRLEAGQEKLQAEPSGVQTGLTRVKAELTGLETSQEKLRVDLMVRMDRLQDALSGVRDDIVTNFGAHLSDSERLEHTRDELRSLGSQMNQLVVQVRKLADRVRVLEGGP